MPGHAPGFSFALHPLRVRGFSFTKRRVSRLQVFTAAFPSICHIPARTIQKIHKPPIHHLCHAGGHTVKRSPRANTRYRRHAGRCTGQNSRPIIIRYIRRNGAPLLWIHARQCSTSQTKQARRSSPVARARRSGAEPLAACAAALFGLPPDS